MTSASAIAASTFQATSSEEKMNQGRTRRGALAAAAALFTWLVAAIVVVAPQAHAALDIVDFHGSVVDQAGGPFDQAGGHPYSASTGFEVATAPDGRPLEDFKDAIVSLPPGFVGMPLASPRCDSEREWDMVLGPLQAKCPIESQVGVAAVTFFTGATYADLPVYNVEPPAGVPARLGFGVAGVPVAIDASVRPGDFGIDLASLKTSQGLTFKSVEVKLWGVPADESHDALRAGAGPDGPIYIGTGGAPISQSELAFIANPTDCSAGPLTTTLWANSWQSPGEYDTASFDEDVSQTPPFPMAVANCEDLPFDPEVDVHPTGLRADAPSGIDFRLTVPQDGLTSPEGIASAHLKRAVVTMPEGMTINPAAAGGLTACTDAQLGLDARGPARCPDGSRIGTVEVDTPLLEERLEGAVYVRSQHSNDPASGEMFRLALEVRNDERGVAIKLPGQVHADPRTGRLRTVFDQNPQLPFTELRLRLKSGPRAPLALPAACGTHPIDTELTSWAGQVVRRTDSFEVACPGASGFAPSFEGGAVNPVGGVFSPFVALVGRSEGQRFLSGVSVDMPGGLLAKLAGVERCGSVEAEHGGCPVGSRIGTATVGAGSGAPFYVEGPVFLTGGYKGAPFGLAVHVRAKAGPFDLGWVRVRQALHVDRSTARVSVVSDPLPQVVKGVPVRLRSVDVDVDRAGFTINPTSCSEKRVGAVLTSIDGAVYRTGSRFQVGDCQALPFEPRLSLALKGRRQRTTGKHPAVRAVVRQSGVGEAGIRRARVVLPGSLALDPDNAQALCEFADGTKPDLEAHCPAGSRVGRARAKTPLLDRDLVGDVYFVKNVRRDPETGNLIRTLPMLVVALRGEIAINLVGKSSTTRDGWLVNTFAGVPDAPITRFNLNIKGGTNGILAVTGNRRGNIDLCAKPRSHRASTGWRGHNGKRADYRIRVKTPCGKQARKAANRKTAAKRRAAAQRKAAAKRDRAHAGDGR